MSVAAHGDRERHGTAECGLKRSLRGTVKAEAAQRRVMECWDKAAERGTTRTKTNLEEGGQTTVQMEVDAPTTTTSATGGTARQ